MAQWFCKAQGEEHGPLSEEDLITWAREGRLGPDDLVWTDESSERAPAKDVKGLFPEKVGPPELESVGTARQGRGSGTAGAVAMEYLKFERMIVPLILQALFWVLTIACVIYAFTLIASGHGITAVFGVLTLLLGPVVVRVCVEVLMVLFRIHDAVEEVAQSTRK